MKINCLKSPDDEKGLNIWHNECIDVYLTDGLEKAKEKRVRKVGGGVALNPPEETLSLAEKSREKIKLLRESIIQEIKNGIS